MSIVCHIVVLVYVICTVGTLLILPNTVHSLVSPLYIAGPFTDRIRQMDEPEVTKICQPSAGIHIVLPDYYSPRSMGLLDPATSDGRVIFFLPWEG